jgi:hypothetical protein
MAGLVVIAHLHVLVGKAALECVEHVAARLGVVVERVDLRVAGGIERGDEDQLVVRERHLAVGGDEIHLDIHAIERIVIAAHDIVIGHRAAIALGLELSKPVSAALLT